MVELEILWMGELESLRMGTLAAWPLDHEGRLAAGHGRCHLECLPYL
jgi:hypothetical protein